MPALWLPFAALLGSPDMGLGATLICVGLVLYFLWGTFCFPVCGKARSLLSCAWCVPSQLHADLSIVRSCGSVGCLVLLAQGVSVL
jgi:hypothetical protein